MPGSPPYDTSTRSTDFMVDHFASFASASGSPAWTHLRDSLYGIVASLQSSYSGGVGLVPDFIVHPTAAPAPAPANFLEADTDGMYSYNACRVPWRLATDFVTNGDSRAKAALDVINAWLRAKTSETPTSIGAGYKLNGDAIAGTDYSSMAFAAPFAVGAMVNSTNQAWLNAMWDYVVTTPIGAEAYYENTLKLLSMIVMSGNWWAPEKMGAATCTPLGTAECTNPAIVADASVRLRGLDRGAGTRSSSCAEACSSRAEHPRPWMRVRRSSSRTSAPATRRSSICRMPPARCRRLATRPAAAATRGSRRRARCSTVIAAAPSALRPAIRIGERTFDDPVPQGQRHRRALRDHHEALDDRCTGWPLASHPGTRRHACCRSRRPLRRQQRSRVHAQIQQRHLPVTPGDGR